MEPILQNVHNILRWLVLLFGLLSLFTGLRGLNGKRNFTDGDKRTALFFLTACDIQLLLGLALYFMKGYHRNFSGGNMSTVMKDSVMRFWTVEHSAGMLLAIILVHIAYAGTKGSRLPVAKFRRLFWCTLLALIIIAVMVPWPFRIPGIARPWAPGMSV
jgi:hypothetical protein